MSPDEKYNPLDLKNLGESLLRAFLAQECYPLPPPRFAGAGVYALYYSGTFPLYVSLATVNREKPCSYPIYVGRAIPRGGRRGLEEPDPDEVLFKRLKEHAKSIVVCDNLRVEDFRCRYLVTDDTWIGLAERYLIMTYKPLWNAVVDGFGNHPPGSGRNAQARSLWDTLHPGRGGATLGAKVLPKELEDKVTKYLALILDKS